MTLPLLPVACATCISQSGQVTTMAANGAVFVMFGALALVFSAFIGVFVSFARRARRYAASQAAEGETPLS
ncbi:MAG: hypothetical protein JWM59_1320 [Verrucomicrobiales bacterium]|nr:hypothetical protein [Verrucomicrobiales bacterium]